MQCVLSTELNDNANDSEDSLEISAKEMMIDIVNLPKHDRSQTAPNKISLDKIMGFGESLEIIRNNKGMTGRISLRQHGFIFLPIDEKKENELLQIQLINEFIRGNVNVYLLDFFKEQPPKSIRDNMDFYLHLQCNIMGVIIFNYAHIAMDKYMKHRYNTIYNNNHIMAFSAIYETVIGRASCAQFITQTFVTMLNLILSKRLKQKEKNKFNKKHDKIWMISIAQTYKQLDKLYAKWCKKQGISQSASNSTQVIVNKDHIYVCNLGSGGAYLFDGNSLSLITQRHITRSKFERLRVLSAGGNIKERETNVSIKRRINKPINKPKFTRTSWNSTCNDEITDSLPADFKYIQTRTKTVESLKTQSKFGQFYEKWKTKIDKFVKHQNITSYETHTVCADDDNTLTQTNSTQFIETMKENDVNILSSNIIPKTRKTSVVIPGYIDTTRIFGLVTTKKECAMKQPKLWITEPHIVKLKRSKDIKAILLVSSEILDTINISKTQKLLTKSINKGKIKTFCEKLCCKCEAKNNPRSTIASLVCFPVNR